MKRVHDLGKGQINVKITTEGRISEEDEEAIAKECVDAGMSYVSRFYLKGIDRRIMEGLYRAMFIARHRHGIPEEGLGGVSGVSDGMREVMRENSENIEKMMAGRRDSLAHAMAGRPRDSKPTPLIDQVEPTIETMGQIKDWATARREQLEKLRSVSGGLRTHDHDIMSLWNCIGRMAESLDKAEKYISKLESVSEQMTRSLYGQNTSPRPEPPPPPEDDGIRKI
jgi:hypothetical protein